MYPSADAMARRIAHLAELETHLSFRISRLSKLLDTQSAGYLDGSGLSLTWYRILLVLNIFEETTAADLSRLMVIDRAQISRAVAELTAGGLVQDRPDPGSKRRKLLSLTEAGSSALANVQGRFLERQGQLEGLLTPADLEGLTAAIDKLSAELARELDRPDAMPAQAAQP